MWLSRWLAPVGITDILRADSFLGPGGYLETHDRSSRAKDVFRCAFEVLALPEVEKEIESWVESAQASDSH